MGLAFHVRKWSIKIKETLLINFLTLLDKESFFMVNNDFEGLKD